MDEHPQKKANRQTFIDILIICKHFKTSILQYVVATLCVCILSFRLLGGTKWNLRPTQHAGQKRFPIFSSRKEKTNNQQKYICNKSNCYLKPLMNCLVLNHSYKIAPNVSIAFFPKLKSTNHLFCSRNAQIFSSVSKKTKENQEAVNYWLFLLQTFIYRLRITRFLALVFPFSSLMFYYWFLFFKLLSAKIK